MSAELEALAITLPERGRLIGVDLGSKTIGLAMSDLDRRIASPLETIRRTKFAPDAARIKAIVARFDVQAIVVGLPLNMDGSAGPRVQATRAFMRSLSPLVPCPIVPWDERLSTVAVTRMLIEADASRARRSEVVDKVAAAYILQGALDRLNRIADDTAGEPADF